MRIFKKRGRHVYNILDSMIQLTNNYHFQI